MGDNIDETQERLQDDELDVVNAGKGIEKNTEGEGKSI